MKLHTANWSRLGMEGLVIILSVLAALAVDDWREDRAERALEQHLLVTLRDDLMADLEELESSLKDTELVEHASAFLLGQPDQNFEAEIASNSLAPSRFVESSRRPDDTSPQQVAIIRLIGGIDFDLSDMTYQEMMSTGSIRVVQDNILRRDITRYYWIVRSYDMTNATAESYRTALLNALLRNGVAPDRVDQKMLDNAIQDIEVRALIAQSSATARTLREVYVSFVEQAEELLAQVDAELLR